MSSQVSQSEAVDPTSRSEDGTDLEVPETPLREPRDQTTQLTPVKRERGGNTAVIQGSPSSGIYDIDSVSGTIHTFSPSLTSVEDSQTMPELQAVQVQDVQVVQATVFDEEEEARRVRDGRLRDQSQRFVAMVAASIVGQGQGGKRSAAKKPAAAARPKPSTKKKPAAKKPMQKKPSAKQGVNSSKKPAAKVKKEAKKKPASCK